MLLLRETIECVIDPRVFKSHCISVNHSPIERLRRHMTNESPLFARRDTDSGIKLSLTSGWSSINVNLRSPYCPALKHCSEENIEAVFSRVGLLT